MTLDFSRVVQHVPGTQNHVPGTRGIHGNVIAKGFSGDFEDRVRPALELGVGGIFDWMPFGTSMQADKSEALDYDQALLPHPAAPLATVKDYVKSRKPLRAKGIPAWAYSGSPMDPRCSMPALRSDPGKWMNRAEEASRWMLDARTNPVIDAVVGEKEWEIGAGSLEFHWLMALHRAAQRYGGELGVEKWEYAADPAYPHWNGFSGVGDWLTGTMGWVKEKWPKPAPGTTAMFIIRAPAGATADPKSVREWKVQAIREVWDFGGLPLVEQVEWLAEYLK